MRRAAGVTLAVAMVAAGCSSEPAEPAAPTSSAVTTTTVPAATTQTTSEPPELTTTTTAFDAVARLEGLSFDDFVERSFEAMLVRSPQFVTDLGIADRFGMRNDQLDDLSDAFLRETMDIEVSVLDLLHGYERSGLDAAQQITYDVYEWYLDDVVGGHPFVYHDYPLHHMLRSYHWDTFFYFTESFPLNTPEDAEDFVAAVGGVREQADQVLEGLAIREEMGIYPPDFIIRMTRSAMVGQLGLRTPDTSQVDPAEVAIYLRFEEDTADLGLDPAHRQDLLDELANAITTSVAPAWGALIDYLIRIEPIAGSDAGVWKLPDGDAYYAHMLRQETSTEMTAEQIHELGLAEVARVQAEIRGLLEGLGYPAGISLSDALSRVAVDGGSIDTRTDGPDAVIAAYGEYLTRVEATLEGVFNLQPTAALVVEADRSFGGGGGFYSASSLDGSRPGAFYAGSAPGAVPRYRMPTILHHEGVPGHHFQIALAQELGLPLMRSVFHFNGYVEGWALYAEYLAKELGVYEDDPYGDFGRLHLELLRAVRLVADTGIHAMEWTREEAQAYMGSAMGGWIHEVDRYVVLPAQATGYKIGMLEILRLRELAETELGDGFDLAAFHDVIIGNGSLPLEILDRLVREWIEEQG